MGLYIFIHVTFQFKKRIAQSSLFSKLFECFFLFVLVVLKWLLSFGLQNN